MLPSGFGMSRSLQQPFTPLCYLPWISRKSHFVVFFICDRSHPQKALWILASSSYRSRIIDLERISRIILLAFKKPNFWTAWQQKPPDMTSIPDDQMINCHFRIHQRLYPHCTWTTKALRLLKFSFPWKTVLLETIAWKRKHLGAFRKSSFFEHQAHPVSDIILVFPDNAGCVIQACATWPRRDQDIPSPTCLQPLLTYCPCLVETLSLPNVKQ